METQIEKLQNLKKVSDKIEKIKSKKKSKMKLDLPGIRATVNRHYSNLEYDSTLTHIKS